MEEILPSQAPYTEAIFFSILEFRNTLDTLQVQCPRFISQKPEPQGFRLAAETSCGISHLTARRTGSPRARASCSAWELANVPGMRPAKGESVKPCCRGACLFRPLALLSAPHFVMRSRAVTQPDENLCPCQAARSLGSLSDRLLLSQGLQGGGKVIKCFA